MTKIKILLTAPLLCLLFLFNNQNIEIITSVKEKNLNYINIHENETNNYCDLTIAETFEYLYTESPFDLGNSGTVYFTKRFSYEYNKWVEDKITISGGRARLEGDWKIISGNRIRVSNMSATSGMFDASRNGDTSGIFTIKCNGDIEGVLKDTNGNRKEILIKK